MANWIYAQLSKDAKDAGGPESYRDKIYDDGYNNGEDFGLKKGFISGIIGAVVLGATYIGIRKLHEARSVYNAKRKKDIDMIIETENINRIISESEKGDVDVNEDQNDFSDKIITLSQQELESENMTSADITAFKVPCNDFDENDVEDLIGPYHALNKPFNCY